MLDFRGPPLRLDPLVVLEVAYPSLSGAPAPQAGAAGNNTVGTNVVPLGTFFPGGAGGGTNANANTAFNGAGSYGGYVGGQAGNGSAVGGTGGAAGWGGNGANGGDASVTFQNGFDATINSGAGGGGGGTGFTPGASVIGGAGGSGYLVLEYLLQRKIDITQVNFSSRSFNLRIIS